MRVIGLAVVLAVGLTLRLESIALLTALVLVVATSMTTALRPRPVHEAHRGRGTTRHLGNNRWHGSEFRCVKQSLRDGGWVESGGLQHA
jgi:hypothetical protein